ncbi:glycosyltransferase family 4 protein [Amphibiibacter pelophylacis]|uniref:Glycosyltransferase family 4 protein n=1 Tax=Amphibiibacter pelophylacis TaxID=1799477 RepID=A0ACC6NZA9_9BURK
MRKFFILAGFAESLVGFRLPLISELQNQGFDVHVAAPGLQLNSDIRRRLEHLGLTVHDVSMGRRSKNPLLDVKTLVSIFFLLKNVRPDFFLGYTIKPVIYGSIAAWLLNVPCRIALITGLGKAFSLSQNPGALERLVQGLYTFALAKVSLTFFQNPDDEQLFRQRKILSDYSASQVVNGSGVEIDRFHVSPMPKETTFLLIARLIDGKGVRFFAEAARIVRASHPAVKFLLVGWIDDGSDAISQPELDSWISAGYIQFLGKLSDVRPAIAMSSVFVLPSFYREGTPRTILEALAMGRPIITTNTPGCRETVLSGQNGFLVAPQSTTSLVEAMLKFIVSPEIIEPMGRISRSLAENKYDVKKVNAAMLSAITAIS